MPALPERPALSGSTPRASGALRAARAAGLAVLFLFVGGPPAAAQGGGGETAVVERPPRCPPGLAVLVQRGFARDAGLEPGDTVRLRAEPEGAGCPAAVAGRFEPVPDPARLEAERPRVLLHLPHLARLAGREREVDRFSVRLAEGADPDSVASDLAGLLPGARVVPTRLVAEESSTLFRVVERFHRAIGFITLAAGSVFLACIMILKVQERRPEVAALRLVGLSRRTVLGWIVLEAGGVAVLGGVLGLGVGRAASAVINRYYREVYDTSLAFSVVTADTVAIVLALAVVLGLVAGLAAGLHLLALDPRAEAER